jgi:hypothetical protein
VFAPAAGVAPAGGSAVGLVLGVTVAGADAAGPSGCSGIVVVKFALSQGSSFE